MDGIWGRSEGEKGVKDFSQVFGVRNEKNPLSTEQKRLRWKVLGGRRSGQFWGMLSLRLALDMQVWYRVGNQIYNSGFGKVVCIGDTTLGAVLSMVFKAMRLVETTKGVTVK